MTRLRIRTLLKAAALALASLCLPALAQTTIGTYASKKCADEGRVCYVRQYPAVVIYATPTAQVAKIVSGPVPCTNAYWTDPQRGVVKSCYAIVGLYSIPAGVPVASPPAASAPTTVPTTPTTPVTTASTPVILNASPTARAGDYISVQGWNVGSTPIVLLDSTAGPTLQLPIVAQLAASNWLSVQLPATAAGGLSVRVQNGTAYSAAVKLNAARPYHLDAMTIVPAGKVRIFGRNLVLPNSTPIVKVDGVAAAVDIGSSNEHMLSVTVPPGLPATSASVITVDNGNGSGPATLDRTIAVVTGGGGDLFALGVGWAASLTPAAARTIDAKTDTRLGTKVKCDGAADDTAAIQSAVQLAQSLSGGTVKLPAGTCKMSNGVQLGSGVVIQGAGKTATTISHTGPNPFYAGGIDSAGLADMTIANAGPATDSILLHDSTRVFLKNVRFAMGVSHQIFLTNNRNMVVTGCDFLQTGSLSDQGPLVAGGSRGFVFTNNAISQVTGTTAFGQTSDGYIAGNHWTRDASYPQTPSTVIHMLAIDFAARVAVIGNTFDVVNGPIAPMHNDGETILTEGGGNARTENLGAVQSATATTIVDEANTLNTDPLGTGSMPENLGIAIVGGKGAGQTRRIIGYAAKTITVDAPWAVIPDSTSKYATMVWGLEKSLIKGNTLTGNPRGIQLYQTGIRDVDVIGNTLTDNGTIMLRAYQSLGDRQFMPMVNVKIAGNVVNNSAAHTTPAAIGAVFTNHDGGSFGTAIIGLDISGNAVTAARPNIVGNSLFDYVNTDGYTLRMQVETGSYVAPTVPRILGTLLRGNACTACDVAVRLGTGVNGVVLAGTTLTDSPTLSTNTSSVGSGETATNAVILDASAAVPPPVVVTPPADPTTQLTWSQVAVDGGSFAVPGGYTRTARYGNVAHNLWSLRNVTGAGQCTTAFFGDDPVNPAAVWGAPKVCQLASLLTPIPPAITTSTMLGMANAPLINLSLIPPDGTSYNAPRVSPTSDKPGAGGGEFRTLCTFSHMTFDDPIVFPGAAGAAHLHSFFGNSLTSATSTPELLRTTGGSTCRGGTANRSAYWVPTMIDTRDGTPLVPKYFEPYYKNSVYNNDVHHLPVGLRMIAGSHASTAAQPLTTARFKCIGGPNNENDKYGPSIPNCDVGAEMWMEVFFPQCWDGARLDSPDHKSHMAYVVGGPNGAVCPADHPVALPAITFNVVYGVYEKDAPTRWRLSSDKYPSTSPGGYSSHGDWFNGWDASVSDAWVDNCVRAKVDCHATLVGDGRALD